MGGGRAGTVMVCQLGQRNDQETTLNEKIHQGGQHVKSPTGSSGGKNIEQHHLPVFVE